MILDIISGTIYFKETLRGGFKLIYEGHEYLKGTKRKDMIYWRCVKYSAIRCPASLILRGGNTLIIKNCQHEHSVTKNDNSYYNKLPYRIVSLQYASDNRKKAEKSIPKSVPRKVEVKGNSNPGLIYLDSETKPRKLILDKNDFNINTKLGDRTFWRCTQRFKNKCNATLATFGRVVKVNNSHNHNPTNPNGEKYLIQHVTILRGFTTKSNKRIKSKFGGNKKVVKKPQRLKNVAGAIEELSANSEAMKKITKTPTKKNTLKAGPRLAVTYKKSKSNNTAAKKLTTVKKPHWKTLVKARRLTSEAKNQQNKKKLHWRTSRIVQQLKDIASSEKNLEFMHVDNQSVVVFRGHTYKKLFFTNLTKFYKCSQYSGRPCPAFVKIYELEDGKIILGMSPTGHRHGKTTIDYDKLTRKDVFVSESIPEKIVPKKKNLKNSTDKPKSREILTRRLSKGSKLDSSKSDKPAAAKKVIKDITSDKPAAEKKVIKDITSDKPAAAKKVIKEITSDKPETVKENDDKIEQFDVHDVKKVKDINKVEPVAAYNDEEKSVTKQENIGRKGIIYFEKTSRSGERLIYEDYEYRQNGTNKKYWQCSKYNNGCRVRLILSGIVLSATDFEHNHPPQDREESEESLCKMVTIMLRDPQKKRGRPAKKLSNSRTVKYSHTDTPCEDKETKKNIIDKDDSDEEIRVDNEGSNSRESTVSSDTSKERNKEGNKRVFIPSDSDTNQENSERKTKKYKGIEPSFKIENTNSGENKAEQQPLRKESVDSDNEIASSTGDEQSIHDFDETIGKLMLEESSAESERDIISDEEISLTDENSSNGFQYDNDRLLGDYNDTNQYEADQVDEKNEDNNDTEKKDQTRDGEENYEDQAEQAREKNVGNDQHRSDDDQLHGHNRHQSDIEQPQENCVNNADESEINQLQEVAENQHNSEDEDVHTGIRIISYYSVNS